MGIAEFAAVYTANTAEIEAESAADAVRRRTIWASQTAEYADAAERGALWRRENEREELFGGVQQKQERNRKVRVSHHLPLRRGLHQRGAQNVVRQRLALIISHLLILLLLFNF